MVGGYDVELVNGDIDVICRVCLHVLREPMQAIDCEHRFCRMCVDQLIQKLCSSFYKKGIYQ